MLYRRLLALVCLFLALLVCVPAQALASTPPEYERAKAHLARLHTGKHSAAEWQSCADAFRKAYDKNPKWRLRMAALYRHGVALEGRARVTRSSSDARKAVAVYEQTARSYASSALADDALFRAAVVYNELLRDQKKARLHLEHIARRYSASDHAAAAERYRERMGKSTNPGPGKMGLKGSPASKKQAVTTKAPSKAVPEQQKGKNIVQPRKADTPKATAKATPVKPQTKNAIPQKPSPKKPDTKRGDPKKNEPKKVATAPSKKAKPEKTQPRKAPAPKEKPIAMDLAAQLGLAVRTVVIDPGHGGRDPGAMHNGVVEQNINLDVAKRLRTILEKQGYKVLMTRDRNKWLSLGERVRFGKRSQGDLFISIHVNAAENKNAHGFETYILDFARSSSVSRLAMIENADSGRLGDMDKILTEILRGARTAESRRLADRIQKSTLSHLKKNGRPARDGGVKGAPFFVLVGSTMPSVLVEIGYCSNKMESNRLKDPTYRQHLAKGIADGIHSYARGLRRK